MDERVPATGSNLVGNARVIDGDTLAIEGKRVRLHGIDAPESDQTCLDGGRRWPCGRRSTRALRDRVAGDTVRCVGDEEDRYGRLIAVCYADGTNLNAWMVEQGWAVAYRRYSTEFVGEERKAESAGAGVWRGRFVMPWEWRRGERTGG
ncbi:succinoglycan biosynthesis protein [Rhodovibrio sodomensis]|uniref:Succinoglycan biosynthesis protein n=2 Tax=Rhodovibrio sodomensis TaxID=1088 RepID=A0ABS1DHC9_9PROT|nr:succinoglycan biosynthesis protein [Rhodovibrio sodomensis]